MTRHEILVLGAGPAGCAAAILLARRAHDIALVRPRQVPAGALAESIPPSTRKLLDELGLLEAVDAAGLHPNEGNTVWWAGGPERTERFADGTGVHVLRERLEDVLVGAAESVGVRVYADTAARDAVEADGWTVRCETGKGSTFEVACDWLIDATGRHGLVARREGRVADRDTTTLALVRSWTDPSATPRLSAPDTDPRETLTLIESHEHGWVWSIPVDRRTRVVTAMIDPRLTPLAGDDVATALSAELARTEHIGPSLEGWEPTEPAWACPASLYHGRRFARDGLLLVGDAASAIDPLSSYGVKKALSSGWLAGVAAHTALVDPGMRAAALSFFDARERELYRESRRTSAEFFQEAADAYRHPFWVRRARAAAEAAEAPLDEPLREPGARLPADEPRETPLSPAAEPGARRPADVPEAEVRAAYEAIRSRPALDAVSGPTLRTLQRPTVRGHRIVMAEHLGSAAYPDGLRWVRGVDLARLVEVAPGHADVPDGWSAYNAVAPPVTLPDYLTALSTAFAAGLLVHREGEA